MMSKLLAEICISRVMIGDVDDAIGFISVCIFYQEKGTFGTYGSMNYT